MSGTAFPLTMPSILDANPRITLSALAATCQMIESEAAALASGWLATRFLDQVRMRATEAYRIRKGTEVAIRYPRVPVGYYTVTEHYVVEVLHTLGSARIGRRQAVVNVIQKGRRNPQQFIRIPVESCTIVPNWQATFRGWINCTTLNEQLAAMAATGFTALGWLMLCDSIQGNPDLFVWEDFYARGFDAELFATAIRKCAESGLYCGAVEPSIVILELNRNPPTDPKQYAEPRKSME